MMGSVCSSIHPVRAWPASWNATTLLSAGDITLLFFSMPGGVGSRSHDSHMTITWYTNMYLQWPSQWRTRSHVWWRKHLWTWPHARWPRSQYLQYQHLSVCMSTERERERERERFQTPIWTTKISLLKVWGCGENSANFCTSENFPLEIWYGNVTFFQIFSPSKKFSALW